MLPSLDYARALIADLGIDVRELVPILGKGTVNEVMRVEKDDGTVILRLNRDRNPQEALYEYHRESWCLNQARAAGIPSPETLGYSTWNERSWMLQTFIPGPTADEVPEENESVWRFLGDCLRRLENLDLPESDPGRRDVFGAAGPLTHWQGQLRRNIESLTPDDPLRGLGVYRPEEQPAIRQAFETLNDLPLRFGLAHGDFSRRNVILGPDGPVLLDWGNSTEGILPYYDIAEAIRNSLDGDPDEAGFRAFEASYGGFAEFMPQIRTLRLLRAFDLVRWAIDQRPVRIAELAASAKTVLEQPNSLRDNHPSQNPSPYRLRTIFGRVD